MYERDRERFTLIVDDADQTSYNMGNDIAKLMIQFRIWGLAFLGDRVIDVAKEFGACQGIPAQDRTVALFERPQDVARVKNKIDFSKEGSSYAGFLPNL